MGDLEDLRRSRGCRSCSTRPFEEGHIVLVAPPALSREYRRSGFVLARRLPWVERGEDR